MDILEILKETIEEFAAVPNFEQMPRNTLADKGIAGPTSAHVIEEVHTPFNLAYVTFTTGSTAFQNIVGVTFPELPDRIAASIKAFELMGINKGDHLLITYPPLVNVFTRTALEQYGITWSFLYNSSREALLYAMATEKPAAVVGESSFIRASLQDAERIGLAGRLPEGVKLITAGTPLDEDLQEVAADILGSSVYDLYGCQEFGWLTVNGIELRDDILLLQDPALEGYFELIVGGLPTGDSFPIGEHKCGLGGKILTYQRRRSAQGYEVTIKQTALNSGATAERAARSILRIKGKVVYPSPNMLAEGDKTVLELHPRMAKTPCFIIDTPEKTRMFDSLLEAQRLYQKEKKNDGTWEKRR